ncbi:hypothetical protein E2C01_027227 [Portunus trituberculatus]|uniref:Uncharacterized protein n=1 Tax=Portunus trituberculatus TaxID=210409 RepID=A0A5B7EHC9_PORTR|nr:hypothetical protein [Portunus trituberculatus]
MAGEQSIGVREVIILTTQIPPTSLTQVPAWETELSVPTQQQDYYSPATILYAGCRIDFAEFPLTASPRIPSPPLPASPASPELPLSSWFRGLVSVAAAEAPRETGGGRA